MNANQTNEFIELANELKDRNNLTLPGLAMLCGLSLSTLEKKLAGNVPCRAIDVLALRELHRTAHFGRSVWAIVYVSDWAGVADAVYAAAFDRDQLPEIPDDPDSIEYAINSGSFEVRIVELPESLERAHRKGCTLKWSSSGTSWLETAAGNIWDDLNEDPYGNPNPRPWTREENTYITALEYAERWPGKPITR